MKITRNNTEIYVSWIAVLKRCDSCEDNMQDRLCGQPHYHLRYPKLSIFKKYGVYWIINIGYLMISIKP